MKTSVKLTINLLLLGSFQKTISQVHPSFNISPDLTKEVTGWKEDTLKPETVSGIDFLPNGNMVITAWGGLTRFNGQATFGKVYLVKDPNNSTDVITIQTLAENLKEPIGIKAVSNDTLYFLQKDELSKLVNENGNWTKHTVYNSIYDKSGCEITCVGDQNQTGYYAWHGSYGLETKTKPNGKRKWYFTTGSTLPDERNQTDNWSAERGAVIEIDEETQTHKIIANGLRSPATIGMGPEGELYTSDAQGHWLPHCKMINIKEGRWYGHIGSKVFETWREWGLTSEPDRSPAALQMAYGEVSFSSLQPMLIPSGNFQGQMLVAEGTGGGLHRTFLENIQGEWQGAVFNFSKPGSFNAGPFALRMDPNGSSIWVGGLGGFDPYTTDINYGNFGWQNRLNSLERLDFNGSLTFEILAIRSTGDSGFEIEFTKPVNPSQAIDVGNFQVEVSEWNSCPGYGGCAYQNRRDLVVASASLTPSSDNKKVQLAISGLSENMLVRFDVSSLRSAEGESPWTPRGWYTLNQFGPGRDPITNINPGTSRRIHNEHKFQFTKNILSIKSKGLIILDLFEISGKRILTLRNENYIHHEFQNFNPGVYYLHLNTGSNQYSKKIMLQ